MINAQKAITHKRTSSFSTIARECAKTVRKPPHDQKTMSKALYLADMTS